MQLKSLPKGHFQDFWQNEEDLLERTIYECVERKVIIDEGMNIMSQGQDMDYLYLVERGLTSMSYTAINGRTFQFGTLNCDYQLFGEIEFFNAYPCHMSIVAMEAIEVHIVSGNRLRDAIAANPKLAIPFAMALAVDYQDVMDIMFLRVLHSVTYNVAYDLYSAYIGQRQIDGFDKGYLEAERFGTTDRVYRRAVKELESLGLISKSRDGIKICKPAELRKFIDQYE